MEKRYKILCRYDGNENWKPFQLGRKIAKLPHNKAVQKSDWLKSQYPDMETKLVHVKN